MNWRWGWGTPCLSTPTVAEATDGANTLYGTDRMLDALNRSRDRTPEELLRDMKADIDRFVGGAPQFDDITMLAIQRKPAPQKPAGSPAGPGTPGEGGGV